MEGFRSVPQFRGYIMLVYITVGSRREYQLKLQICSITVKVSGGRVQEEESVPQFGGYKMLVYLTIGSRREY